MPAISSFSCHCPVLSVKQHQSVFIKKVHQSKITEAGSHCNTNHPVGQYQELMNMFPFSFTDLLRLKIIRYLLSA